MAKKSRDPIIGMIGKNTEFLLMFTSEKKAELFLQNIGKKPKYHIVACLLWREIVRKYKVFYKCAAIYDSGKGSSFPIVPLS